MEAIKGFIARHQLTEVSDRQASEGTEPKSLTPSVSAVDDELFKTSLSAALMKNAEATQPWSTIGVDQWIESGRWWLLRSQMELYAVTVPRQKVPLAAYANLIKASWILVDIIACHPQVPFIKASTHSEVQLLSAELKNEFSRLSALQSIIPDLSELEGQDLRIWETQARGPLLRPRKDSRRLDEWTVDGGEQVLFQRFALCKLHVLTDSLPSILLFLVREDGRSARLVTQNQNGVIIMAVSFQTPVHTLQSGSSIAVNDESITFNTAQDAHHLGCLIEATNFYYFSQEANPTSLEDLKAYVLLTAVKNQKKDVIEQLLQRTSPKNNALGSESDGSPVVVASMLASQRITNQLIDASESDPQDISLFCWAVQCGIAPLVKVLLAKLPTTYGRDWERKDWEGMTPLGLASFCGHEPIVRLLIGSGTDVQATDSSLRTALHHACSEGHEGVVRLLLRSGADVQATDILDWAALDHACSEGHEGVARLLLRSGAEVRRTFKWHKSSALHLAAQHGHKTVVQVLIDRGADIEAPDYWGSTPLCQATSLGHEAIIALLLEKGANVNQRNRDGINATHYALESQMSESTVRAILAKQPGGRDNNRDDAGLRREKVVLEVPSDCARFYLDSPNAVIEMPNDVPRNVKCAYDRMISVTRLEAYALTSKFEFTVVHYENALDFSIGHGKPDTTKTKPRGWFNIKIGNGWERSGSFERDLKVFTGVKLGETAPRSSAENRTVYRQAKDEFWDEQTAYIPKSFDRKRPSVYHNKPRRAGGADEEE